MAQATENTATPETLKALRDEAADHGDTEMMRDCEAAMAGDREALDRVVDAATDSEHSRYRVEDGELVRGSWEVYAVE